MSVVEVKLWGTTVGHLGYADSETSVATFEYSDQLQNSDIEISPLKMPNRQAFHSFPDISETTFKGLPGIFADSLPDKFGNQLIDIFMAEKKIPAESVTALDRLLYIGNRGMGALEYHPARELDATFEDIALDIAMLSELASMVVAKSKQKQKQILDATNRSHALRLIKIGSSAGGARAKALVAISPDNKLLDGTVDHGIDHSYWLLKFDSEGNQDRDSTDPKGMTKIEFIYSLIARECQINLPVTDYIEDGDDFHFLIERFDRIKTTRVEKLHYASWCGLDHAHRDNTGVFSYEQLILCARSLGLGEGDISELFRRAVFNIVGRNQDDHTKNFGFTMNKLGQWRLAPAFDLTYSFDPTGRWTKRHQIKLARKQEAFDRKDLHLLGEYCNLEHRKADAIISQTSEAFSRFDELAREYAVSRELAETIGKNLRLNL